MQISLSEHFTYSKLLRFTLPSIAMMIFTSIYGVVDGIFVSNMVGEEAFTAVNFIMPVVMILSTTGFMFGTGGSALVAKLLGEKKDEKANQVFSLIVYTAAAVGMVLAVIGIIFMKKVALALGADEAMAEQCAVYGRIVVAALPFFALQMAFQSLFITAEKPKLGFAVTVAAGVGNMIFDALFMGVFKWGVAGAAVATALSQAIGGIIPLIYFFRPNSSLLRLGKTVMDIRSLWKTCTNGSSELVSQASMSIVNMLYNSQLMKYIGKNGVSAYGVMMYVNLVFLAIFIGFSVGSAPIVSYHYGAENHEELKGLRQKSLVIIGIASAIMLILSQVLARPLASIFVGYNEELLNLTTRGFRIFAVLFLFAGLNIFGSSFFTALNNGPVSAAISFLRTVVFQVGMLFLLPLIFDADGIWASVTAAEMLSAIVTVGFLVGMRKKYKY
ncbi:MAG: MATE family efflux transporter [Ruminococcaceae bacterium]|nr:MATE family efflux transporter [Oscillospiraceae bacterium]